VHKTTKSHNNYMTLPSFLQQFYALLCELVFLFLIIF